MLYNPARHEPPVETSWSETVVRETIDRIVTNARSAISPSGQFPAHPRDNSDAEWSGTSHYFGSAGILWALGYLDRERATAINNQWLIDHLTNIAEQMQGEYEGTPMGEGVSMMFGDLPICMQLFDLTNDVFWRDQIVERMAKSIQAPVQEMMWGMPGVLILSRLINDAELRNTIKSYEDQNIKRLFDAWSHEQDGITIWLEELYGHKAPYLGPVHGFTGQVLPLLQRFAELSEQQRKMTLERTRAVLLQTALQEDGQANWPAAVSQPCEMVQYCHGAAGVVISMCEYPAGDTDVDELLLRAGELIWQAGPLTKGSNLCHGTGGNGYAFLKLFARIGEERWLEHARGFAMHGIAQYGAEAEKVGFDRFSL